MYSWLYDNLCKVTMILDRFLTFSEKECKKELEVEEGVKMGVEEGVKEDDCHFI